jgi:hypothetical protein
MLRPQGWVQANNPSPFQGGAQVKFTDIIDQTKFITLDYNIPRWTVATETPSIADFAVLEYKTLVSIYPELQIDITPHNWRNNPNFLGPYSGASSGYMFSFMYSNTTTTGQLVRAKQQSLTLVDDPNRLMYRLGFNSSLSDFSNLTVDLKPSFVSFHLLPAFDPSSIGSGQSGTPTIQNSFDSPSPDIEPGMNSFNHPNINNQHDVYQEEMDNFHKLLKQYTGG